MYSNEAVPLAQAEPGAKLGRVVVASAVGTALEWYDFFVYGYAGSLIFDRLFFPKFDPLVGTLLVFASFGIGIVARPVGGLIFGHFGDRLGRKSMLLLTVLLMGGATALIGMLPTYEAIGFAAPALLVLLRIVQGLAIAGESIGANLLTVESVPENRRGLYGAIIQAGGPLGAISASVAIALVARLPEADLLSWGWRIPFLVSLVLVVIGFYIRLGLAESPIFKQAMQRREIKRVPILEVFRTHKAASLVVFFTAVADTSVFYLASIFALSYGTKDLGIPRSVLSDAIVIGNVLTLLGAPLLGSWADRIGRRRMYMAGLVLMMLYIYPFFALLQSGSPLLATVAIVGAVGVVHSVMWAVAGSYFPELFEPSIRFSGVSLAKQLGTVFGGGFIPLIATALLAWSGGNPLPVVVYFILIAAIALVAMLIGDRQPRRAA